MAGLVGFSNALKLIESVAIFMTDLIPTLEGSTHTHHRKNPEAVIQWFSVRYDWVYQILDILGILDKFCKVCGISRKKYD